VRVTQRSASSKSNTSVVIACECLFCVYFGRKCKVGFKRNANSYIKNFKIPFRTDNYTQYYTSQHQKKGKQYQEASEEEKKIARWTATEIDIIEQEHQELVAAYHNEAPLQSALNACDDNTTFEEGWSIVKSRFKYVLRFYGGVASVFPGTSQVEKVTFLL